MPKMRIFRIRKKILFIIFLLIFVFPLKGNEKKLVIYGKSAFPLIDKKGDLIFIYKNWDGRIRLATKNIDVVECNVQDIFINKNVSSSIIKEDRKGEIWAVWEQEDVERNDIYFGQLKGNKINSLKIISQGKDFNFSPDLSFDYENNPWITWVCYSDKKFKVLVKNLNLNKIWLINSPFLSAAYNPKIIIDGNNLISVFWTGRDKGRDEIIYSVFNGFQWSTPYKLNKEDNFPHILHEVGLDHNGFTWLVWSAYDGNDYEIFCSFWNGKNWSPEERITDNKESDSYPSLSFVSGNIPLIVWSKSYGGKSGIYCRYKYGEEWSREIEIFRSKGINRLPKIVIKENRIGIIWESKEEIKSELFYFSQLIEKKAYKSKELELDIIFNSTLNENKYIGFGDSITYGYVDRTPAPEKGYIPRLEYLLNENFGYSEVINEGWPGEVTINGLGRIDSVITTDLARYLLLMEGTNDVIFKEISMDTTAFNLEQMIQKCLDFGVFPLIATIIPRDDWRWGLKFYKDRIFYLNEKICELIIRLLIPFVDQFNAFYSYPEDDGGWQSLLSDGVHPDEIGYQLMADEWFDEIKILPFPPININIKREYDEILFYRQEGNNITWKHNPNIFDDSYIKGYKIYRKKADENNDKLHLIATVYDKQKYFDSEIIYSERYAYVISTLRTDGIEGPCSDLVKDY